MVIFTDNSYEAVWNKSRKPGEGGKTLEDYHRLMAGAFVEMFRVLKPGRWASVVFHNSDDKVWDAIRDSAEGAGFTIENVAAFDKQQKTFKGIKGEKGLERVSNMDIVLNLRKPVGTRTARAPAPAKEAAGGHPQEDTGGAGNGAEAKEVAVRCIEKYLLRVAKDEAAAPETTHTGQDPRGVQAIHSSVVQMILNEHLPMTGVSLGLVVRVLNEYCKEVDGRWYLPGEQVRSPDGAGDASRAVASAWAGLKPPGDEASAIEWAKAVIRANGPQLEGDLTDRFRQAAPNLHLSKPFRRMLEENFTFDQRRGRWRLPTPAEAEAKLSIKVRLLEGTVAGILSGSGPPPDAERMGQLLELCYHEGLFQQAYDLWKRINPEDLPPERYKNLERIARVCKLRAQSTEPG
ncbi:MAG: hypothetical protein HY673_10470 [Chloroflexi bacterium]|nr:hypothetical protein [Chloroflexota bacterium]